MAPADSPATAGLAAVEYGYPLGHLGHLTEEEQTALDNFKVYLANENLYKPGPPPSHDDILLLRFLRARKWVLPEAAKQFKDTEEWRRDIQIDVLYDTIDVEAYDESRQLYPQWTGRRDRRGIPVYLFEIKHLDNKTIARYEKSVATTYSKAAPPKDEAKNPAKLIRLFALYENLTRFVQPLCTQLTDREHERTSITLSTNIVDVSGVSLKGFWNLKGHMQLASQLATAHYPETLDRIFVSLPYLITQTDTRLSFFLYFFSAVMGSILTDRIRLILDPRCTHLLLHRLGLDQALVRPRHRLQNLYPLPIRGPPRPDQLHRHQEHPQGLWR